MHEPDRRRGGGACSRRLHSGLLLHQANWIGGYCSSTAIGAAADIFRQLEPSRGIWAVPGNWDHTADAVEAMQAELAAAKVHFLINESSELEAGLWLVGVDDPATSMDDVSTALESVPAGVPRLLLAHAPDIAENITDVPPFDLILVGHTHGGQVHLPRLGWQGCRVRRRNRGIG